MRSNEIFLATSNRKEGWGATINEAMASGCCVVASDAMGAAPFLIEDGANGIVFLDGNLDALSLKVSALLDPEDETRRIGAAAAETLAGTWSACEAARRLLLASAHDGSGGFPACGPVSPVQIG